MVITFITFSLKGTALYFPCGMGHISSPGVADINCLVTTVSLQRRVQRYVMQCSVLSFLNVSHTWFMYRYATRGSIHCPLSLSVSQSESFATIPFLL